MIIILFFFFFQAEDGIRDFHVTGVQTCALPICVCAARPRRLREPVPRTQGQGHGPPSAGLGLHPRGPGHPRGTELQLSRSTDPLSWHNTRRVSLALWGKGGSVCTLQPSARRKTPILH